MLCFTLLLMIALPSRAAADSAPLAPTRHGDFAHYTFALTWQPGFCRKAGSCLDHPPQHALIGLHGLWASRPQSLIDAGVTAPQWWHRGCDYFHHTGKAPALSSTTLQRLHAVMPQLRHSLLTHEYDKHVQCFGFDTQRFFDTELAMRQRIVHSRFGRYLLQQARGHTVQRSDVIAAFMHGFDTDRHDALQLRCDTDASGRVVLSQLWITLHANAVAAFPHKRSLMNAPIAQDNCPSLFRVPAGRR
ncbi:MAG: ribonuclease I [Rhodanobacter sp.]|nr:MAG: ribonuclease I [Rhodanobacter sp.]